MQDRIDDPCRHTRTMEGDVGERMDARTGLAFDLWCRSRADVIVQQYAAARSSAAERDQQPEGFTRSTSSPNKGRRRVPNTLPANAATSHSQPCRLPDTIPLK